MNDASERTPTPGVLYIHDDLTDTITAAHGRDSPAAARARELLALTQEGPNRVVVLTLAEQIERLLARGDHSPFALALGIGRAGEALAVELDRRRGWFPERRRVDIAREEDGRGGYTIASLTGAPLRAQLTGVDGYASLAVLDDTIFSGMTLRTVLAALPPGVLGHTHVFCLRGVAATAETLSALCPITVGYAVSGRLLHDVSFINASGLVRRGAIRRPGGTPLAFFERPEWIEAWFPGRAEAVIALCRRLGALLDQR